MDWIFIQLNSVWAWLGTALLGGLVTLFLWLVWDIIRDEIRWWRKSRDYRRYLENSTEE